MKHEMPVAITVSRRLAAALAMTFALVPHAAFAIPTVVNEFNSLYVGVDGSASAAVTGSSAYDFVGLGVRSTDPGLTGAAPYLGNPDGTLEVGAGATLGINYRPSVIGSPVFRPLDNSVLVGTSLGATGTLNVTGGTVNTPILFVGQADGARPTSGTANITAGGQINATLDSGGGGPLPGFPAINIGRGLGSSGTVNVSGAGSTLTAASGMMSLGREGAGTLQIQSGGVVSVGSTVFMSTVSATGSSSVLVQGAGSRLDAGSNDILVGIATDKSNAVTHGTAELNVRDGGEVKGNLFVGAGGTLKGDGLISGNVVNDGGTLSPGNSPGTLHVNGDYTQNGGLMVVEIAGPSIFDVLDVTGNVLLDNVLIRFVFTGGYGPAAGDSFGFLKGANLSLQDLSYEVVGLQDGFTYGVSDINGVLALNARTNGIPIPEPHAMALLAVGLILLRRYGRSAPFRSA